MHVALLHCQTVGIRCETCKWWHESQITKPGWGSCLAAADPVSVGVAVDCEDATRDLAGVDLQTAQSHFCAIWEPKE